MLKDVSWYWWILFAVLYVILSVVVMRRGMWPTVGQKIMLTTIYALILFLPALHSPASYILAVGIVLDLLIYQRMLRRGFYKLEIASKPPEPNRSDR